MNKVAEEFKEAYVGVRDFINNNMDHVEAYVKLCHEYEDNDFELNNFKMLNILTMWINDQGFSIASLVRTQDDICWDYDFFDNPSQFVKDFEAKCIEEQEQKDIEIELKDKENRRKQFKKLQEEFKDEM